MLLIVLGISMDSLPFKACLGTILVSPPIIF